MILLIYYNAPKDSNLANYVTDKLKRRRSRPSLEEINNIYLQWTQDSRNNLKENLNANMRKAGTKTKKKAKDHKMTN